MPVLTVADGHLAAAAVSNSSSEGVIYVCSFKFIIRDKPRRTYTIDIAQRLKEPIGNIFPAWALT
jgi:hypothetical protein